MERLKNKRKMGTLAGILIGLLISGYSVDAWGSPEKDESNYRFEDELEPYQMDPDDVPEDLQRRKKKAEKELAKVRELIEDTDLRYVSFDENEVTINEDAIETLNSVANIANKFPRLNLLVAGHADSRESKESNMFLSEQRAKAVESYLIQSGKIDSDKILSLGFGESMLIGNSNVITGRKMNRRVEFKFFVPKKGK